MVRASIVADPARVRQPMVPLARCDNGPKTIGCEPSAMRRPTERDRAAAAMFGLLAALLFVLSIGQASLTAGLVGGLMVVAGLASLRGYPIDRDW